LLSSQPSGLYGRRRVGPGEARDSRISSSNSGAVARKHIKGETHQGKHIKLSLLTPVLTGSRLPLSFGKGYCAVYSTSRSKVPTDSEDAYSI